MNYTPTETIARLALLQAQAAGSALKTGSAAAAQLSWSIDRIDGSPTGTGAPDDPVDSAATIVSRWTGGIPGTRPRLPDGTKLILHGAPPAVVLSGTLGTVSSFARTAAAGQIRMTDGAVADFSPYKNLLFHDKTSGGVSWLYEPLVAGATGIVATARTALTPGTVSIPAMVTTAPLDLYELLSPTAVYFGSGCMTRLIGPPTPGPTITISWLRGASVQPDLADPVSALLDVDGVLSVFIYRLWGQTTGVPALDTWVPQNNGTLFSAGSRVDLQECRLDQAFQLLGGNVRFFNCALTSSGVNTNGAYGPSAVTIYAGFGRAAINSFGGASVKVDGDFLIDRGSLYAPLVAQFGGVLGVGYFSSWGAPTTEGALQMTAGGQIEVRAVFAGPGEGVTYGTVGPSNPVAVFNTGFGASVLTYDDDGAGTAPARFQFDSVSPNWLWRGAGHSVSTTSWAFNPATGRMAGTSDGTPANNLWTLMSNPVNGPGYDGTAIDPISGSMVTIFA